MAKTAIIIDGEGITATLGSTAINDINTVSFGIGGERQEINLTTIEATKYVQKLLGDLENVTDIIINKKSDPTNDMALYSTSSETLTITYKIGKSTGKQIEYYAQLKNGSNSVIERTPASGINIDLVFKVTNLNDFVEDGPTISST